MQANTLTSGVSHPIRAIHSLLSYPPHLPHHLCATLIRFQLIPPRTQLPRDLAIIGDSLVLPDHPRRVLASAHVQTFCSAGEEDPDEVLQDVGGSGEFAEVFEGAAEGLGFGGLESCGVGRIGEFLLSGQFCDGGGDVGASLGVCGGVLELFVVFSAGAVLY